MTKTFVERDGQHLEVQRHGDVVALVIVCVDQYAAIELYDHLIEGAEGGGVDLMLRMVEEKPL